MAAIVSIVADVHSNSKVGLCPPVVELDGVGSPAEFHASKMQRVMWDHWLEHRDILGELKVKLGVDLITILAGDGSDDNKYDQFGLITTNKADIIKIGLAVLEPLLEVSDQWIMVRGTEAHTGPHCWQEEMIAMYGGAAPDEEAGTDSWWWWPGKIEDVRFHIAHRPPTFGNKPWTIDAAAGRCSKEVRDEYIERGELPPQIAAFGHYHKFRDSGRVLNPYVVFLPSWSWISSYVTQMGHAGFDQPIGGVWFICDDGKYDFHYKVWRLGGKKPWIYKSQDSP